MLHDAALDEAHPAWACARHLPQAAGAQPLNRLLLHHPAMHGMFHATASVHCMQPLILPHSCGRRRSASAGWTTFLRSRR